MNIVTQKTKKRQRIIEYSLKHGKSEASRKYKEPLSNIKRWSKRYDGTWQSLKDKSGQPHSHSKAAHAAKGIINFRGMERARTKRH